MWSSAGRHPSGSDSWPQTPRRAGLSSLVRAEEPEFGCGVRGEVSDHLTERPGGLVARVAGSSTASSLRDHDERADVADGLHWRGDCAHAPVQEARGRRARRGGALFVEEFVRVVALSQASSIPSCSGSSRTWEAAPDGSERPYRDTVHLLGAGPPFGVRNTIAGQVGGLRVRRSAPRGLDAGFVHRPGSRLLQVQVHGRHLVTLDEHLDIAVSARETPRSPRSSRGRTEKIGIEILYHVEMQDWEHRTIRSNGIQEARHLSMTPRAAPFPLHHRQPLLATTRLGLSKAAPNACIST